MEVNYKNKVDMKPIRNSEIRSNLRSLNFEEINVPIYIKGFEICESNIVGYVTEIYIDCSSKLSDYCGVKELDTIQSEAIFENQEFLSKLELVPIYVCVGDKFHNFLYFELCEKKRDCEDD